MREFCNPCSLKARVELSSERERDRDPRVVTGKAGEGARGLAPHAFPLYNIVMHESSSDERKLGIKINQDLTGDHESVD